MKLQHLIIIFAIIFLPIIIITSYYIQKQVDTIDLQLSYDSKLLDATYDAMTAFEINTANEDLSTVSDSLRGIIEASNSIFLNTLATNLGYSNASISYVQPYVPAVLYTLYDGFYIYAPSNEPEILTDKYGQTLTVGDYGVGTNDKGNTYYKGNIEYGENSTAATSGDKVEYDALSDQNKSDYGQLLYKNKDGSYSTSLSDNTYYKQDYILKSYVPYSASYSRNDGNIDIDVTINYTLDNYISVTGTIGDVYYSKSGYLIDSSLVKNVAVKGKNDSCTWYTYSDEEWEKMIHDPENYEVTVTFEDDTTISNTDTYDIANEYNWETHQTTDSTYVYSYWDDTQSAVEYYIDSWMFSEWVYENLGSLAGKNIVSNWGNLTGHTLNDENETEFNSNLIESVANDGNIFARDQDPEGESTFESHREKIIKNSINYNLALAILAYSDMRTLVDYDMPIFTEDDWDKILNNVTVVSLMQGLSCGLKYYNNYAVAVSTNNEVTVTTSEIYYVPIKAQAERVWPETDDPDDEGKRSGIYLYTDISDIYIDEINGETIEREIAHRIDCPGLNSTEYYISFRSKEIKYDKVYDKDRRNLCL